MKRFSKNLIDIAKSVIVFGTGGFLYAYYITNRNYKEIVEDKEANRDNTRLSNQSYGISWGWRADDIIMSQIDTGDLLFLKFQCKQATSIGELFQCMKYTWSFLDHEYHALGIAFRDQSGVRIIFNEFGSTKIIRYPQLVAKPYLCELAIRKIKNQGPNLQKIFQQNLIDYEKGEIFENREVMVNSLFKKLKLLKYEIKSLEEITAGSMDCLKGEFQQKIFVRTTTAKDLRNT